VDGDELLLKHEFLSMMLGVRRAGVSLAMQQLEGAGRIRAKRGRVTVLDRKLLEEMADSGYGMPEAEYARLIEGA
jgi:DNA-binding transcriptional regulator YhcF (GntR family)